MVWRSDDTIQRDFGRKTFLVFMGTYQHDGAKSTHQKWLPFPSDTIHLFGQGTKNIKVEPYMLKVF